MGTQCELSLDDRIETVRGCKRVSGILAKKGVKTFRGLSRRKEESLIHSCLRDGLTPHQLKVLSTEMKKREVKFVDWQTSLLRIAEGVPEEFVLWCWERSFYSWNDVFAALDRNNQALLEELLSYKDKCKKGPIADLHFYLGVGLPLGGASLLMQRKVSPKHIRKGVSFNRDVISPLRKHGVYADQGRTFRYSVWFVRKKMADRRKGRR